MNIAILCSPEQKEDFSFIAQAKNTELIWADSIRSLLIIEADIYIDALFEFDQDRIRELKKITGVVIVNSIPYTTGQLGASFIRLAGWPTLLGREKAELAFPVNSEKSKAILIEAGLDFTEVPDCRGMVTPRIIAMIINEAYFALGEKVSSQENIDTAMKTGTNYPYGPFEWGEKIGLATIAELLKALNQRDSRYEIAPAFREYLSK